jgi:hypothetical protein
MKLSLRLPGGRVFQRWLPWLVGLACLAVFGVGWLLASRPRESLAAPLRQQPLPTYNWFVCEDLGIGSVPGAAGSFQRFRLCHNRGWQVLVYCIEPLKPPPPLNTNCARIDANTYWCGDLYQLLRPYQVAETPTPGPFETPTPSATQTATPSATATITATSTPTSPPTSSPSATASSSPTPGGTFTQTSTPTGVIETPPASTLPPAQTTVTAPPGVTLTVPVISTPRFTPTPRPAPGGPGNVPPAFTSFLWLGLLSFVPVSGLAIWLSRRYVRRR